MNAPMPDEFAELREALVKFNQAVKFPPQTPNIVFGIIRETEKLLAAYDRVVNKCVRPWPGGGFTLPIVMVINPDRDACYGNYCWFPDRASAIAALLKEEGK